jgi:hypothetical protein
VSDRPEDVDAAFAEIVADLEREGVGVGGRADPDPGDDPGDSPVEVADEPVAPPPAGEPTGPAPAWRGHEAAWDWSWGTDDEHYVPPEPPPLPRLRPMTITALVLVIAAILLLIAPSIVGLDARIGVPIALLSLVCGFGLFFLRLRRSPTDADGDNGAQV